MRKALVAFLYQVEEASSMRKRRFYQLLNTAHTDYNFDDFFSIVFNFYFKFALNFDCIHVELKIKIYK